MQCDHDHDHHDGSSHGHSHSHGGPVGEGECAQHGAASVGYRARVNVKATDNTRFEEIHHNGRPIRVLYQDVRQGQGNPPVMVAFASGPVAYDEASKEAMEFIEKEQQEFRNHSLRRCAACTRSFEETETPILTLELAYIPTISHDGQVIGIQFEFLPGMWCMPCTELLASLHGLEGEQKEQLLPTSAKNGAAVPSFVDAWSQLTAFKELLQSTLRDTPAIVEKQPPSCWQRYGVHIVQLCIAFFVFFIIIQRFAPTSLARIF